MTTAKKVIKANKHHGPDVEKLSKEPRHQGRRQRVKLPTKVHAHLTSLPEIDFDAWRTMTSSAKGRGLEECVADGKHDPVVANLRYRRLDGSEIANPFAVCRRCGERLTIQSPLADSKP